MARQSSEDLVNEAVEELGVKWQQLLVLAPGGAAYAFTSSTSVIIAISAHELEGGQSGTQAAALMSLLFGGYTVGNLLGGFFADFFGRRWPLIVGFLLLAVLQSWLAFVGGQDFWLLATSITSLGVAMGLPQAASSASIKEWSPERWRSALFAFLFTCLAIGQISPLVMVVVWFRAPSLHLLPWHWERLFLACAGVSAFFFVLSLALLPETPQWLNEKKGAQAAAAQLRSAAWWNSITSPRFEDLLCKLEVETSVEDAAGEATPLYSQELKKPDRGWLVLPPGRYVRPTVILCWTTVIANATYYGLMFALPRISAVFSQDRFTPAALMIIAALCEIPGICLQMVAGRVLTRRSNVAIMFGLLSVSAILLGVGITSTSWLATLGALGMKTFAVSCFIITYVMVAEAYSISHRGIGIGFCLTVGRFGAIASPLVHNGLNGLVGNDSMVFFCLAAGAMIAAGSGYLLPT